MKIGLLGCGTVGKGMTELLRDCGEIEIAKVLLRRPRPELKLPVCYAIEDILNDPEITLVAEAIGGLHPAYEYVKAALLAGKHVVTANKQLMVAYYKELTALAKARGVALRCTAAAGGGIPWLSELGETAKLDRITGVSGIMNGTTNYILTRMAAENVSFPDALREAQALGYAEADPTADIEGYDVRRKLTLSANIGFGVSIAEEDIPTFGIGGIDTEDVDLFRREGLACRFIADAEHTADGVEAAVCPVLFPADAPEAAVDGCLNRTVLRTAHIGTRAFSGEGAGGAPTASNMIRDCYRILAGDTGFYTDSFSETPVCSLKKHRFYLRTDFPEQFPTAGKLGSGYLTRPMTLAEICALRSSLSFAAMISENTEVRYDT